MELFPENAEVTAFANPSSIADGREEWRKLLGAIIVVLLPAIVITLVLATLDNVAEVDAATAEGMWLQVGEVGKRAFLVPTLVRADGATRGFGILVVVAWVMTLLPTAVVSGALGFSSR